MRWLTWRAISARPYAKSDQAKTHATMKAAVAAEVNDAVAKAAAAADAEADPSKDDLAGGVLREQALDRR
jgi:hypothetical protein